MVVDVFRKVEHDNDPDIIRSNLDISVIVVGFEKGTKETIVEMSVFVGLAGFLISEESYLVILVPQRLAIEMACLDRLAFESLQVNDLISLALHINDLL